MAQSQQTQSQGTELGRRARGRTARGRKARGRRARSAEPEPGAGGVTTVRVSRAHARELWRWLWLWLRDGCGEEGKAETRGIFCSTFCSLTMVSAAPNQKAPGRGAEPAGGATGRRASRRRARGRRSSGRRDRGRNALWRRARGRRARGRRARSRRRDDGACHRPPTPISTRRVAVSAVRPRRYTRASGGWGVGGDTDRWFLTCSEARLASTTTAGTRRSSMSAPAAHMLGRYHQSGTFALLGAATAG